MFIDLFARMDEKMAAMSAILATVVHDVRALQTRYTSTTTVPYSTAVSQSTPVRCANNNMTKSQHAVGPSIVVTTRNSLSNSLINNVDIRPPRSVTGNVANTVNAEQSVEVNAMLPISVGNWATEPVELNSQLDALSSDDQQLNDDYIEQPFTRYESRRHQQKRRRQESRQQEQQKAGRSDVPASSVGAGTRARRGPLMIGKSAGSTTNPVVSAANGWYRKSVFYIDNVDSCVTEDDLKEFVKGLSVRFVSCNEVKPRRRRNETTNGKAFRLCINRDDRQLLLDADKWPAYVAVSDWIFKQPKHAPVDTDSNKRQRIDQQQLIEDRYVSTVVLPSDELSTANTSMDTTILVGSEGFSTSASL